MSWMTMLMAIALTAHPERSDISRGSEGSPSAHREPLGYARDRRSDVSRGVEGSRMAALAGAGTADGGVADGGSRPHSKRRSVDGGSAAHRAGSSDAGQRGANAPSRTMAPEVKALVDRMQAFYEKTSDFTAGFRQEYTYKIARRTQSSSGKVFFLKPAMMRWEYEKPSPKVFVLAQEKAYAYDPEALTLTITNVKTNELSASVTFLMGVGRLENEFSIARADCPSCKGVQLELTPLRPDPRFQMVKLEVDPQTAQVLKSTLVDPDGSQNAISFFDLKTNQGFSKDQFKLKTTVDTQVIDLTRAPK